MSQDNDSKQAAEPVYVIETIPVGGEHGVSPGEIQRESIPVPDHLRLFREIGRLCQNSIVERLQTQGRSHSR